MKNSKSIRSLIGFFGITLVLVSCSKSEVKQEVEKKDWKLVWSDEFNENAGEQPDPTKWNYDLGNGIGGWGNQELQNYTDNPANCAMDGDGNLIITAIKSGNSFTSARIKSKGLFEQKYGRFEARIITPFGPGIWPAFWMLGSNIDEVSWPTCGEIDIMELKGNAPNIAYGSLHGPGYSGGNAFTSSYALENDRFDNDYHIYAVEWDENKIDFYIDDFLYKRMTREEVEKKGDWVYDNSFFLILNIAVGGNFVGFPIETTPFPQKMTIDYIRVYQ